MPPHPPRQVQMLRLTWVLTGVLVTLCALLAGPDAWAAVDGHKWESLACFLDLFGVRWAWGVVSATRGSAQLSLADPWTFQPWLMRTTADAYFFPVDSPPFVQGAQDQGALPPQGAAVPERDGRHHA